MKKLATTLIAGTALASIMAAPALADEHGLHDGAFIINGQLNFGDVWTTLDVESNYIDTDVAAVVSAVGNNVMVVTMSNTIVENDQSQFGNVGAVINANAIGVRGDAIYSATALCNGATISTDPDVTSVTSNQNCGADDPLAEVNVHAYQTGGGVGVAATAVANQIQIDSNANHFPVNNFQQNVSDVNANVNAHITDAWAVSLKASAVGNTAQIIHYPSDPTGY